MPCANCIKNVLALERRASTSKTEMHELLKIQNLDLYAGSLPLPELSIQTLYEGKHLAAGKTIKYLQYRIGG